MCHRTTVLPRFLSTLLQAIAANIYHFDADLDSLAGRMTEKALQT
jgi:hypothetical protein